MQAPHDIPDAPPSSKSTGGDVEMEESDMVISENSATAFSSSLETNETQDDDRQDGSRRAPPQWVPTHLVLTSCNGSS